MLDGVVGRWGDLWRSQRDVERGYINKKQSGVENDRKEEEE
jgi:hypothetical protein